MKMGCDIVARVMKRAYRTRPTGGMITRGCDNNGLGCDTAGFSAVAALRVLEVRGRAAFSGAAVGTARVSAAVDSVGRASAVRTAVSCTAAEGVVSAGVQRSPSRRTEKRRKDAMERRAAEEVLPAAV